MLEFLPGELKTAIVTMSNPTAGAFDYLAELYMGTNLVLMVSANFHLDAGESKDISLPVTMPGVAGAYPVYIGVFSSGESIGLYKAIEDVVIAPPTYPSGITILEITGERKADGVYAYVKWVWHSRPFDPDARASCYCELGRMENGVWRNYWTIEPFSGYPPEDTPSVITCRWPEEIIQEMISHEEIAYGDRMGFRCQVIAWVYWNEIGSSPWVIIEDVVVI